MYIFGGHHTSGLVLGFFGLQKIHFFEGGGRRLFDIPDILLG